MAAKKRVSAKRPVKKTAAKRPTKKAPASKSATRATKKSGKRPVKKATTKRAVKRVSVSASKVDATKIEIPPVPNRSTTAISTTPSPSKSSQSEKTVKKSSSPTVLIMVIAGVVLLALFALTNRENNEMNAPTPEESVSESVEPTPETSESESTALTNYEAPVGFVAINNGNGGVTLRWKAPAATEGITGYAISVSYNAKDFTEVTTTSADVYSFDIAMASEEGGTQFLIQTVYSDGTKVDGKKFSLKGKYQ